MIKKRYFKNNKQYFDFVRRHPEFKIENIQMTKTSIVVEYSKKRGRPRKMVKIG